MRADIHDGRSPTRSNQRPDTLTQDHICQVDPRLPKDFALLVRIQRVNDAGFLPDNQDTLSALHTHEDRRLTKIVVWTIAFRTVGPVSTEARRDEAVVCGSLPMPEHPTGCKLKRKNRVARFRGRVGIVVPCRDIERLTL